MCGGSSDVAADDGLSLDDTAPNDSRAEFRPKLPQRVAIAERDGGLIRGLEDWGLSDAELAEARDRLNAAAARPRWSSPAA